MEYWESRTYVLNATLPKFAEQTFRNSRWQKLINRLLRGKRQNEYSVVSESPIVTRGEKVILQGVEAPIFLYLNMPADYGNEIHKYLSNNLICPSIISQIEFLACEIEIYEFGILNQLTKFKILDSIHPPEVEGAVYNAISKSFPYLNHQIEILALKGEIVKSDKYHFGVPFDLRELTSVFEGDSHLYSANYITNSSQEDRDFATKIKKEYNPVKILTTEMFELSSNWGIDLWEYSSPSMITQENPDYSLFKKEFNKLSYCLNLVASQSVILETANLHYTSLLKAIVKNRASMASSSIRDFFTVNDYLFHNVLQWKTCLDTDYRRIVEELESINTVSEKKERYYALKDAVRLAVEGLETHSSRRSNRYVQFFLACLSLLGIQSLFISLVDYLSDEPLQWYVGSERFWAITMLVIPLSFFALWVYNHIKRL